MKKIALIFVIFVSFSGGFMISAQNGQFKPKYKANWNGIDGKISRYVQNHISENGTYEVTRLGDGKTHIVSVQIVGAGNFQMKFDNKPGNRSPNNLNWGDLNPDDKLWWKGESYNWIDGGDGYDYLIDVFLSFCGNTGTVRRPHVQNIEPEVNPVNGRKHDAVDNNYKDNPNIIIEGDDSKSDAVDNKPKSNCNNNGGIRLQGNSNNPTLSGGGFGKIPMVYNESYRKNTHQDINYGYDNNHKEKGLVMENGFVGYKTGWLWFGIPASIFLSYLVIDKVSDGKLDWNFRRETTDPTGPNEEEGEEIPPYTDPTGPGNGH